MLIVNKLLKSEGGAEELANRESILKEDDENDDDEDDEMVSLF